METINLTDISMTDVEIAREGFALDVLTGLSSTPKKLPSKYFYDDRGSQLFQKITEQPEYYLTRAEEEILKTHGTEIAKALKVKKLDLIELGAGDGHKTKLLIQSFLKVGIDISYFPIDISHEALVLLQKNIQAQEGLRITGLVGDYDQGLTYMKSHSSSPKLVLFLGSNIGNFKRVNQKVFLRQVWKRLSQGDYLLSGFDLKKNIDVLLDAYNDGAGVTKDFNLNLLTRINEELGGKFNLSDFSHFETFNPVIGAMESFLISQKKQKVWIDKLERHFEFDAFEPIHLEYSFKFLESEIKDLANETGFEVVQGYKDDRGYFIDSLWQVKKGT